MSDLADRTIERALAAAIAERTPEDAPRGFAVIALGKLGGRELNYSSDVDLIYLYDPETLPRSRARSRTRRRCGSPSGSPSCCRSGPRTAMPSGSTSGCGRRPK